MTDILPDRRLGERLGPGRPKGGRRVSDPILDLRTHPGRYVTVRQLAEYWAKHAYTVNAYIRKGHLHAVRVGNDYRITPQAALAFERRDPSWRKRTA